MKLKNINIIVSAIAVLATALVIYLIRPEEMSELYKVNIALIFMLELIGINAIHIATNGENYSVNSIAVANLIIKPLVLMVIWLVVYSLLLTEYIDVKYYYVGQVVIPAIYSILAVITAYAGGVRDKNDKDAKVRDEIVQRQNIDLFKFQQQVKQNLKSAQVEISIIQEIEAKIKILFDKLRFNGAIMNGDSYIASSLDKIVEMSALIETSPTNEELVTSVLEKLKGVIEYINSKK